MTPTTDSLWTLVFPGTDPGIFQNLQVHHFWMIAFRFGFSLDTGLGITQVHVRLVGQSSPLALHCNYIACALSSQSAALQL